MGLRAGDGEAATMSMFPFGGARTHPSVVDTRCWLPEAASSRCPDAIPARGSPAARPPGSPVRPERAWAGVGPDSFP